MAIFHHSYDKRASLSEPQFTRMRHRFRGPRESEKVNLEVQQLLYSITKLIGQYNYIRRFLFNATKHLHEGQHIEEAVFSVGEPELTRDSVAYREGQIFEVDEPRILDRSIVLEEETTNLAKNQTSTMTQSEHGSGWVPVANATLDIITEESIYGGKSLLMTAQNSGDMSAAFFYAPPLYPALDLFPSTNLYTAEGE